MVIYDPIVVEAIHIAASRDWSSKIKTSMHRRRPVGDRGAGGLQPPNILLCTKELTVIKD